MPSVQVIAPVRTGPPDRWQWVYTRFRALVLLLVNRGLPLEVVLPAARAMLVHLIRETGWGRAEWNFAPANIKCRGTYAPADDPGWHGKCHSLNSTQDGVDLYRAYDSIEDGLADYLRLQESRHYWPVLQYLLTTGHGLGWYDRLMRAGYHPWSGEALEDFERIERNVQALAVKNPTLTLGSGA